MFSLSVDQDLFLLLIYGKNGLVGCVWDAGHLMARVFDGQIFVGQTKLFFNVVEVEHIALVLLSFVCPAAKNHDLLLVGLNARNSCSLNDQIWLTLNWFPIRALTERGEYV